MSGALLALALAVVYWSAPVSFLGDSRYSLLLSHSLWAEQTWDLTFYFPLPLDARTHPGVPGAESALPYQVRAHGKHVFYFYPPGPSLLSLPVIAVADTVGQGPARPGRFDYDADQETRLQRALAAALTAAWGWLVYVTARRWLAPHLAWGLALAAGLGTPALSITSRGVFFETWLVLGVQGAVLLALRGVPPLVLGSLLAWLELIRPSAVIAITAMVVLVMIRHGWRRAAATATVGLGWAACFLAGSLALYGTWRPPYYMDPVEYLAPWSTAVAHLVSPSRGLFVFVPTAVVVLALVVWRWRGLADRGVAAIASAAIVAHLALAAGWRIWWAGHSYGPRLMLETLPWLVLLGILAVELVVREGRTWARVALVATAGLGLVVNAPGAFGDGYAWNARPVDVNVAPERAWSWRDPQFLAWTR